MSEQDILKQHLLPEELEALELARNLYGAQAKADAHRFVDVLNLDDSTRDQMFGSICAQLDLIDDFQVKKEASEHFSGLAETLGARPIAETVHIVPVVEEHEEPSPIHVPSAQTAIQQADEVKPSRETIQAKKLYEKITNDFRNPETPGGPELLVTGDSQVELNGRTIDLSYHELFIFNALVLHRDRFLRRNDFVSLGFHYTHEDPSVPAVGGAFSKYKTSLIEVLTDDGRSLVEVEGTHAQMKYRLAENIVISDARQEGQSIVGQTTEEAVEPKTDRHVISDSVSEEEVDPTNKNQILDYLAKIIKVNSKDEFHALKDIFDNMRRDAVRGDLADDIRDTLRVLVDVIVKDDKLPEAYQLDELEEEVIRAILGDDKKIPPLAVYSVKGKLSSKLKESHRKIEDVTKTTLYKIGQARKVRQTPQV